VCLPTRVPLRLSIELIPNVTVELNDKGELIGYEEILKEARSRFEPGKRLSWTFDSLVGDEPATC
jgi:hypothetical protein